MKKVDDYIRKNGEAGKVRLVLQVHDELVFEVSEELADEVAKNFKKIMEGVLAPSVSRGVPIVAEAHSGKNWGEMEKI